MIILDIIIAIPLLWAIYKGFKDGIMVQLCGLAGLFLGVYFAFRFGPYIGSWLGINPDYSALAGFFIVIIVVIIALALLGKVLKGLLKFAGLGMVDRAGGVLISALKMILITGLLLSCFNSFNNTAKWVDQDKLAQSHLYTPLVKVSEFAFPFIDSVRERIMTATGSSDSNTTSET